MPDHDLDPHLAALQAELQGMADGAPLDPARLHGLLSAVEERLEPSTAVEAPEGLVEGLKHWVESVELEHPTLAAVLNRVMVTLGNTGI